MLYLSHPLTFVHTFAKIVRGRPIRRGALNARRYSYLCHFGVSRFLMSILYCLWMHSVNHFNKRILFDSALVGQFTRLLENVPIKADDERIIDRFYRAIFVGRLCGQIFEARDWHKMSKSADMDTANSLILYCLSSLPPKFSVFPLQYD